MPPPRWYDKDVMLGVEEDKYYLSELQCVLRREFIEAFGTSQVSFSIMCFFRLYELVMLFCEM